MDAYMDAYQEGRADARAALLPIDGGVPPRPTYDVAAQDTDYMQAWCQGWNDEVAGKP